MNFKKKMLSNAIAGVLAGSALVAAVAPMPVSAANHPNSNVSAVQGGVQYLDITVNTDWDYDDANVVQKGTASTTKTPLGRQYLTDLINQTARTLFVMTNGKHAIGNVYIYKNGKFGSNVDVRVLNTIGRANADISGWRAEGNFTTNNYITNCNVKDCPADAPDSSLDPENATQTGEVIAHELGHYVYGLFDEYVEAGRDCATSGPTASSPCKDDVERPTAMNNQAASYRLSVPEDYPGKDFGKTAHGRAYGKSAWETLVSDPANDIQNAVDSHEGRRTYFDAFKGMKVPALSELKKFTDAKNDPADRLARQTGDGADVATFTGYNTNLRLIFEGAAAKVQAAPANVPRNVIVLDRSLPASTFAEAKKAAEGLVDRAAKNAAFALVLIPGNDGTQDFALMNGNNAKSALKSAIDSAQPLAGPADLADAYSQVKALVDAQRSDQGYDASTTDTLTLYTLNTTSVPANLGKTAHNDKIAFNIIGFKAPAPVATATSPAPAPTPAPANANSLEKLAKDTGGTNNTASSASEAIKEASKGLQSAMGETETLIASDLSDEVLKKNAVFSTQFTLGDAAVEGPVEVRWYFDAADEAKLSDFNCTPPGGSAVQGTITSLSDTDKVATCVINPTVAGLWTASVSAVADTAGPVELEVVSKKPGSPVEVSATIEGGTKTDNRPPKLMVKLAGQFPIINAKITVEIFDATSNSDTPVKTLTLTGANDAAVNGDFRAKDGIYTYDLANQLPAGSYALRVTAKTDATSLFNPVQIFVSSNMPAPGATSVGNPIERLSESEFALEVGAPGVGVGVARGGGCTVGKSSDAGLLILLSAAVLAFMRRRLGMARKQRMI